MSARQSSNNVKAGVFVLIALAIGVAVIFILGDLWGKLFGPSMNSYDARFSIVEGVGFLQPGSEVRAGGIAMGTVSDVTPQVGDAPLREIEVTFSLPADVSLYSNAVATVQSGLISADSYILLSSVGWDAAHRSTGDVGDPGPCSNRGMCCRAPRRGACWGRCSDRSRAQRWRERFRMWRPLPRG